MKIEVTAQDIASGKRVDCDCCPLALALNRATNDVWHVTKAEAYRRGPVRPITLPPPARKFIADFDACNPVFPFTFELELEGAK